MKKLTLKILVLALIVFTFGALAWTTAELFGKTPTTTTTHPVATEKRTRTTITYTAKANVTSLEQLKSEANDVVIVTDKTYGEYVDSIEGYKGGTDGKYWSFYVNGKMSTVGAGNYIQKGGEAIEWKFQKL